MISNLLQNSTFSSVVGQANKNASVQPKNEAVSDSHKTTQKENASTSKVDTIKEAIKNGTYTLNMRESAEKLAQELLR